MQRIKVIIDDPSILQNPQNVEAKAAIAFAFISRIEAGPKSAIIKYRIPVPDCICEYRF
jgi:hypothetical protein